MKHPNPNTPEYPNDAVEVCNQPGVVGLITTHGPISVTISLSPEQAEQVAELLLENAQESRNQPNVN